MLFATTDIIPGDYEVLGVVTTTTNSVGSLLQLATDAQDAPRELGKLAEQMGGNAVIGIRYSPLSDRTMLVTGTAIRTR